ncbi:DUF4157 domain-containing protein [Pelatocladus sp. BLCC-F211]
MATSPTYGSLSAVVQRVQQDPNTVNGDERQQLESAIGTRSTREILAGKKTPWVPQFQGISAQLWADAGHGGETIQAKGDTTVDLPESSVELRPNKTGLPDNLKAGVENLSGYSLDDVRVHYNSPKPAQVQALAYTQGTDIHVAPGQDEHLPHEAWHVVQQMQGRVKPTMQMKEVQINDDEGLETEADVMGAKAELSVKSIESNPINLHHEKRNLNYLSTENQGGTLNLKAKNQDSSVIQRNPIINRLNHYRTSQDVKVSRLATHILDIIGHIENSRWQQAYNLLYSRAMADRFNHTINLRSKYIDITGLSNEKINVEVELGVDKGMYFVNDKKLNLPDVALLPNNDISQAITPENNNYMAMKVLPVALEEWIHMFQHMIGGYLSGGTELFATSTEVAANPQWSLNEVDIYAIYKDLGWLDILDVFRQRYQERQVYDSKFSQVTASGNTARRRRNY